MTASIAKDMKTDEGSVLIRVFTHPVCTTCHLAIRMAEELSRQRGDLVVRVISLANGPGRDAAANEHVLSVPTVLVGSEGTRFVGVPKRQDLVHAIEEAKRLLTRKE